MDYNNDFRYDLQLGQIHERWLGEVLTNASIEVKRDYVAAQTGRVFVEFESRGNASGLATSEAEYWAFVLSGHRVAILPTERLREICRAKFRAGKVVRGGDNNTSRGVLVELGELLR